MKKVTKKLALLSAIAMSLNFLTLNGASGYTALIPVYKRVGTYKVYTSGDLQQESEVLFTYDSINNSSSPPESVQWIFDKTWNSLSQSNPCNYVSVNRIQEVRNLYVCPPGWPWYMKSPTLVSTFYKNGTAICVENTDCDSEFVHGPYQFNSAFKSGIGSGTSQGVISTTSVETRGAFGVPLEMRGDSNLFVRINILAYYFLPDFPGFRIEEEKFFSDEHGDFDLNNLSGLKAKFNGSVVSVSQNSGNSYFYETYIDGTDSSYWQNGYTFELEYTNSTPGSTNNRLLTYIASVYLNTEL